MRARETLAALVFLTVAKNNFTQIIVYRYSIKCDERTHFLSIIVRVGNGFRCLSSTTKAVCPCMRTKVLTSLFVMLTALGQSNRTAQQLQLSFTCHFLLSFFSVRWAIDRNDLMAEWFYETMAGAGTCDQDLIRLTIARSEVSHSHFIHRLSCV